MAKQCARKSDENSEHGSGPKGDDVEPIEAHREDVEMRNDEDEEPLEAEVLRARMNTRVPPVERNNNMKILDMLSADVVVLLVSKVGSGGQHRIELLVEEERERTTPIVAFDHGFMTQENEDTLPIVICRDSRYGQTGATCCERKGPTAYSISFLVGFIKDLCFRRSMLKCDSEPSTKSLHDAVMQACAGVEVVPQRPPEGDHMANGAEITVRDVKR